MLEKFQSRKFIISLAAFLASIATSISGMVTDNQTVIIIGTVCGVISAALYSAAEAFIDAKAVRKDE